MNTHAHHTHVCTTTWMPMCIHTHTCTGAHNHIYNSTVHTPTLGTLCTYVSNTHTYTHTHARTHGKSRSRWLRAVSCLQTQPACDEGGPDPPSHVTEGSTQDRSGTGPGIGVKGRVLLAAAVSRDHDAADTREHGSPGSVRLRKKKRKAWR